MGMADRIAFQSAVGHVLPLDHRATRAPLNLLYRSTGSCALPLLTCVTASASMGCCALRVISRLHGLQQFWIRAESNPLELCTEETKYTESSRFC